HKHHHIYTTLSLHQTFQFYFLNLKKLPSSTITHLYSPCNQSPFPTPLLNIPPIHIPNTTNINPSTTPTSLPTTPKIPAPQTHPL
ncbi:hypothetical protein, partial [Bacillus sp. WP8]|uniref:hypothetical protein n=1 Tax=Bacillus sp. WP8 TaxID=756828 RepID=UPI001C92D471